jgi:hypothetical protein
LFENPDPYVNATESGQTGTEKGAEGDAGQTGGAEKTFTQAQMDAAIATRLARANRDRKELESLVGKTMPDIVKELKTQQAAAQQPSNVPASSVEKDLREVKNSLDELRAEREEAKLRAQYGDLYKELEVKARLKSAESDISFSRALRDTAADELPAIVDSARKREREKLVDEVRRGKDIAVETRASDAPEDGRVSETEVQDLVEHFGLTPERARAALKQFKE